MNGIVFLDRDGVINKKATEHEYITSTNDFFWINKVSEYIKYCNDNNLLVIVVTNQQGIGKGLYSIENLEEIHNKINKDLSLFGAKVDKFYFCPHLKDENCNCRKPKTGMLEQAVFDLGFYDKVKMILIGDSDSDIKAANSFGIKSLKIDSDCFKDYYQEIVDLTNTIK